MTQRILPILYVNLGGEMLHILDQRLNAQKVKPDQVSRVLHDIVATMFNRRFIEEIFMKHCHFHSRRVRIDRNLPDS